jgi:hypothetical protein
VGRYGVTRSSFSPFFTGPKDGGLFGALKLRLADTNRNLAKVACDLIAVICNDMGKPVGQYAKVIGAALLGMRGGGPASATRTKPHAAVHLFSPSQTSLPTRRRRWPRLRLRPLR